LPRSPVVLRSIVIQHLEALRTASGGAICVCYVYFRYSQRTEITVRNVLEIIVRQTFERHPECRDAIERAYAQHLQEDSEPTVVQLLGLLQVLSNGMLCTFYVLDALDEAPTRIQLAVVKTLASLNVKLFITSRPLKNVQTKFPQAYTIIIFAQDADIDLHIAQRIEESADLQDLLDQAGPALKAEIIAAIKQNCGRM
jgi:ankyrin repeat domain-containing protein 50